MNIYGSFLVKGTFSDNFGMKLYKIGNKILTLNCQT